MRMLLAAFIAIHTVAGVRPMEPVSVLVARAMPHGATDPGESRTDLEGGWNYLTRCGPFVSEDDRFSISFEEHGTFVAFLRGGPSRVLPVKGTWSFTLPDERFVLSLDASIPASGSFLLLVPDDASVCILAPGRMPDIDVLHGWFAVREPY